MINRVLRTYCRLLPTPIRRLHPIHHVHRVSSNHRLHPIRHIQCSCFPPCSVLSNIVAYPLSLPLSTTHLLRMHSRSLRPNAGFRPLCAAYVPPLALTFPHVEHLGVVTFSALCLPSIGFPRTLSLSTEYALFLRPLGDLIACSLRLFFSP